MRRLTAASDSTSAASFRRRPTTSSRRSSSRHPQHVHGELAAEQAAELVVVEAPDLVGRLLADAGRRGLSPSGLLPIACTAPRRSVDAARRGVEQAQVGVGGGDARRGPTRARSRAGCRARRRSSATGEQVFAVDGRVEHAGELDHELVAQLVAALLDLGHAVVGDGRVGLAVGYRARQTAGGDGLGELALEDRRSAAWRRHRGRGPHRPAKARCLDHATLPECGPAARASGRADQARDIFCNGTPKPARDRPRWPHHAPSRRPGWRPRSASALRRASAAPRQPLAGAPRRPTSATPATVTRPPNSSSAVGRSPSQANAMTTATRRDQAQRVDDQRGRRPRQRVDPRQVGDHARIAAR